MSTAELRPTESLTPTVEQAPGAPLAPAEAQQVGAVAVMEKKPVNVLTIPPQGTTSLGVGEQVRISAPTAEFVAHGIKKHNLMTATNVPAYESERGLTRTRRVFKALASLSGVFGPR